MRYRVASATRSKKAFTSYALKQNLGKLRNLANDPKTMTAIVNQTIERGWSGFFELKDPQQKPAQAKGRGLVSQMRVTTLSGDDVRYDGEDEDIDY